MVEEKARDRDTGTARSRVAEQLRAGDDLVFEQVHAGGRVHILDPEPGPVVGLSEGAAFLVALGRRRSLCGIEWVTEPGTLRVSTFADDLLCARCYRGLRPEDRSRAFEHPTAECEDLDQPCRRPCGLGGTCGAVAG